MMSNMFSNNVSYLNANKTNFNSTFTNEVLPVLYLIIFAVGLMLNMLAAWLLFWETSSSGLVVYLKNMVATDVLRLFTYPWLALGNLGFGGWRLQAVVCRYFAVLFYSTMYIGIVFLGLIGLERYVMVVRCHSRPLLLQSVAFAQAVSLCTWAALLLFSLPNVILTSRPAGEHTAGNCMKLKTPLGVQWHGVSNYMVVAIFWATLALLAFCYSSIIHRVYRSYQKVRRGQGEARRRSNRSIFSVLLVFCCCFVPYHMCRLPYTLCQTSSTVFGPASCFLLHQLKEGTLFLSAVNVCLDPIIYFLMCKTFRAELLRRFSGLSVNNQGQSVSNL